MKVWVVNWIHRKENGSPLMGVYATLEEARVGQELCLEREIARDGEYFWHENGQTRKGLSDFPIEECELGELADEKKELRCYWNNWDNEPKEESES